MRFGWVFFIVISCLGSGISQQSDVNTHIDKINKLLPALNTNATNKDFVSQSVVSNPSPGVIILTTTNSRKDKEYDKSEFSILVNELDKNKLNVKKIECCNVLEFYCEDRSFDCVEYLDRTSKQLRPVPHILMNKDWKENQHVIFNLERLIEALIDYSPDGSREKKTEVVQLQKNGGIYLVNLKLGSKPATAILDSGASVVSISKALEKELLKDRVITRSDYITPAKYRIANGDILVAERFVLPSLTVGKLKIKDVVCSIVDDSTAILLGKSFLDRFAKWSIDNKKQTLTLER